MQSRLYMKSRFKYYLSQGFYNLRHSIMICIAFALALSIISGLGFYSEAYEQYAIQKDYSQLIDFDFSLSDDTLQIQKAFSDFDENLSTFLSSNDFSIDSLQYYAFYKFDSDLPLSYWYINQSRIPTELKGFYSSDVLQPVRYYTMGSEFYSTSRFSDFFKMIEGRTPANYNEIVLDFTFAELLNASVGDQLSIPIRSDQYTQYHNFYLDPNDDDLHSQNAPYYENTNFFYYDTNFTLVGTYASSHKTYSIAQMHYKANYEYDFLSGEVSLPDYTQETVTPVMGYYDFSNQSVFTDFQQTVVDINFWYDTYEKTYLHRCEIGLYAIYNRELIKFGQFSSSASQIQTVADQIRIQFSGNSHLINYLSYNLENLYARTETIRKTSLMLTVPLVITAIILGFFTRKTEIKARMDEYLLLRSKGSPVKMLVYQFAAESLFIGLFSVILGVFLGLGNFLLFQRFYNILFDINPSTRLSFVLTIGPVINTTIFGFASAILGSLSALFYILNLPISKLLKIKESGDSPPEIDEKSLYGKPESLENGKEKEKFTPSEEKTKIDEFPQDSTLNDLYLTDQVSLRKRMVQNNYNLDGKKLGTMQLIQQVKDSEELKEKQSKEKDQSSVLGIQSKKRGVYIILVSLIPIVIYIFGIMGVYIEHIPTLFVNIGYFVQENELLLSVFIFASPPICVIGIIRIFLSENPRAFAKWVKGLSNLFVKDHGYLIGIEMVKKRQIKVLVLILAIFTSLFGFANLFTNSYVKNEINSSNILIGADLQVELHVTNPNIKNYEDIQVLEATLKSYQIGDDIPLCNQINSILIEETSTLNPNYRNIFYVNMSEYFSIISEDNKPIPIQDFDTRFQAVIDYNSNNQNSLPGIIVNSQYALTNNLDIGDETEIMHRYFNQDDLTYYNESIQAVVVEILDFMPGLYVKGDITQEYSENLILDQKFLNLSANISHSRIIHQFIDLNFNENLKISQIPWIFTNITNQKIKFQSFNYYDQSFKDKNLAFSANVFGFYIMVYIDFIVMGILISFGASIMMVSFQKENKFFNGLLLSRGFGKRRLLLLITAEIFVIFFTASLIGLGTGLLFSFSYLKLMNFIKISSQGLEFILYMNLSDFILIFGLLFLSTICIMGFQFIFERRNNISKFLHKF